MDAERQQQKSHEQWSKEQLFWPVPKIDADAFTLVCITCTFHIVHFFWPYLDGNCRVLRFQPFEVSALDKRKISKTSEPSATTDTSGSPNTNIPSIWRILWEESVFSTCLCTVPFLASKCYLAMQMYICHSLYTFKAIPCPCLSCVI